MNGFTTLSQFAAAVKQAAEHPAHTDPRLAAASGMNTTVPSEGGFLVQPEHVKGIMGRAYKIGTILPRVTKVNTDSEGKTFVPYVHETSRKDGSRFGGLSLTWTAEGETVTPSAPSFARLQLRRKRAIGLCYVTDEMLHAGSGATEEYLTSIFAAATTDALENVIVAGSGSGQPLGILSAPGRIEVDRTAGGQIQAGDVRAMYARLWGPARRRAVWLANESTGDALLALADSNLTTFEDGGLVLCGRPVLFTEHVPALGTAGDLSLVDMSDYCLAMDDLRLDYSPHLKFAEGEGAFRLLIGADGTSTWATSITPRNGSTTLSGVVVLK